jgi:CHAT domain-containing protein
MQGALARLSGEDRRVYGPRILIQLATFRAQQKRMDEARRLFAEGIAAADSAGDIELAAIGWNRLGEEYLKQNNLARAEAPLLEAYRIRSLHTLPLDSSYRSLGRLRLEQGDLDASSALLDQAVKLSKGPQGAIPSWDIYHYRGRVRAAQGRLREALDDLRIAVRLARVWRWSAPAEDAMRIGAEGWLEQVHSALVETGNRLYRQTADPSLIRETFEAAEENRASSLSALVRSRQAEPWKSFPPDYWEAIARLQQAEVQALRGGKLEETVQAARPDLVRVEAVMDPAASAPPAQLTERARASLDRRSALLSFHLGKQVSWLWALDTSGLALYELPGRDEIAGQVDEAARAIRHDGTDSGRLSRTLFGLLSAQLRGKTRWLLALAPGLFEAPFAALLQEDGSRLAENHTIEIVPGAAYWLEAVSRPLVPHTRLFVGVGDPIYNTADPRLPKGGTLPSRKTLTLARLVGSGAEVEECARGWAGERVLLKGADASRSNLQRQLARDPAVVHIATHVIESQEQPSYGLIALSLTPARENELVPPFEIAGWRTRAGLVVLSGCRSGDGEELPGAGLQGLTRAWLSAGARTVIASHWSTFDSSGALFGALYRHLSGHPELGPAAALRSAQLEALHSGGWQANPRYWGAYFALGTR